jgi:hypothetical protein
MTWMELLLTTEAELELSVTWTELLMIDAELETTWEDNDETGIDDETGTEDETGADDEAAGRLLDEDITLEVETIEDDIGVLDETKLDETRVLETRVLEVLIDEVRTMVDEVETLVDEVDIMLEEEDVTGWYLFLNVPSRAYLIHVPKD